MVKQAGGKFRSTRILCSLASYSTTTTCPPWIHDGVLALLQHPENGGFGDENAGE